jgi:hypothetical protein
MELGPEQEYHDKRGNSVEKRKLMRNEASGLHGHNDLFYMPHDGLAAPSNIPQIGDSRSFHGIQPSNSNTTFSRASPILRNLHHYYIVISLVARHTRRPAAFAVSFPHRPEENLPQTYTTLSWNRCLRSQPTLQDSEAGRREIVFGKSAISYSKNRAAYARLVHQPRVGRAWCWRPAHEYIGGIRRQGRAAPSRRGIFPK